MLALLVEWILNGSAHGSRLSVASTNLMDLEHLAGLRYSYTSCIHCESQWIDGGSTFCSKQRSL
jgi:hypothetical protein